MRTALLVLSMALIGFAGCGMPMAKTRGGGSAASATATYSCTRCGGSHAQPGNCPKCGMTLKTVSSGSSSAAPVR